MKICICGAGAIGGHIAFQLAAAGADVSAVVRGANLDAIRRDGLRLRTENGERPIRIAASSDPRELGVQDLVIVTVKAPMLGEMARLMQPLLGPDTPVLFVTNGIPWWYYHGHGGADEGKRLPLVDPGNAVWDAVGPHRAIGGIAFTACTLVAPGLVEVKGGARTMVIGEPDNRLTPRLSQIASLLKDAGFPVECTEDIRQQIWKKLILNMSSGVMGVLAPVPLKDMFADPVCVDARLRLIDEGIAIAASMGCRVDYDMETRIGFVRNSSHIVSIAQDVLNGREPEIRAMFQAPLQMARDKGVSTPTLDLLVALGVLKTRDLMH